MFERKKYQKQREYTNLKEEFVCNVTLKYARLFCWQKRRKIPMEKTAGIYDRSLLKTYVLNSCAVYRLQFDTDYQLERPLIGNLTLKVRHDLFNTLSRELNPTFIMDKHFGKISHYKNKLICKIENKDVIRFHISFCLPLKLTYQEFPLFLCLSGKINNLRVSSVLPIKINKKT